MLHKNDDEPLAMSVVSRSVKKQVSFKEPIACYHGKESDLPLEARHFVEKGRQLKMEPGRGYPRSDLCHGNNTVVRTHQTASRKLKKSTECATKLHNNINTNFQINTPHGKTNSQQSEGKVIMLLSGYTQPNVHQVYCQPRTAHCVATNNEQIMVSYQPHRANSNVHFVNGNMIPVFDVKKEKQQTGELSEDYRQIKDNETNLKEKTCSSERKDNHITQNTTKIKDKDRISPPKKRPENRIIPTNDECSNVELNISRPLNKLVDNLPTKGDNSSVQISKRVDIPVHDSIVFCTPLSISGQVKDFGIERNVPTAGLCYQDSPFEFNNKYKTSSKNNNSEIKECTSLPTVLKNFEPETCHHAQANIPNKVIDRIYHTSENVNHEEVISNVNKEQTHCSKVVTVPCINDDPRVYGNFPVNEIHFNNNNNNFSHSDANIKGMDLILKYRDTLESNDKITYQQQSIQKVGQFISDMNNASAKILTTAKDNVYCDHHDVYSSDEHYVMIERDVQTMEEVTYQFNPVPSEEKSHNEAIDLTVHKKDDTLPREVPLGYFTSLLQDDVKTIPSEKFCKPEVTRTEALEINSISNSEETKIEGTQSEWEQKFKALKHQVDLDLQERDECIRTLQNHLHQEKQKGALLISRNNEHEKTVNELQEQLVLAKERESKISEEYESKICQKCSSAETCDEISKDHVSKVIDVNVGRHSESKDEQISSCSYKVNSKGKKRKKWSSVKTEEVTSKKPRMKDDPSCLNASFSVENKDYQVELVADSGVFIQNTKLTTCLLKSRKSPTMLMRFLLDIFFTSEVLASSSAAGRGHAKRPPLSTDITTVLIKYIQGQFDCSDGDMIQAINQKCTDARKVIKKQNQKKLQTKTGACMKKENSDV